PLYPHGQGLTAANSKELIGGTPVSTPTRDSSCFGMTFQVRYFVNPNLPARRFGHRHAGLAREVSQVSITRHALVERHQALRPGSFHHMLAIDVLDPEAA